ncbi:MAG: hypothetical protein ACLFQV_12590, partial [Vulcanimicrobiota bacterium]
MSNHFLKRFYATIIFLTVFSFMAGSTEAQETPPQLTAEAWTQIREFKKPELPESLNGIPRDELKGIEEITVLCDSATELKTQLVAEVLLYEDINFKLSKLAEYAKNNQNKSPLSDIFSDSFKKAGPDNLIEKSEFELTGTETALTREAIEARLKQLGLPVYEEEIIELKKVVPEDGRIYYDNARIKVENWLKDDIEKARDINGNLEKAFSEFSLKNIKVSYRIGTYKTYAGVKKNFDSGDPLIVGFTYSAQDVKEAIPLEWLIKTPTGQLKSGITTLEGDIIDEYHNIYEGKIPQDSPNGKYSVEIVLYPGEEYEQKFEEYFWVGGGNPFEITSAFILDKNKKACKVFKPGETVLLVMRYRPFDKRMATADFGWRVFDPSGNEVPSLTTTQELKVWSGKQDVKTKYIKGIIPKNAQSGSYNYQAVIKKGEDKELSQVVTFDIQSDFVVKIVADKTQVKPGEKVNFKVQVMGGREPFKYLWKSDTMETSTSSSIAIIFSQPGERWVTLTV